MVHNGGRFQNRTAKQLNVGLKMFKTQNSENSELKLKWPNETNRFIVKWVSRKSYSKNNETLVPQRFKPKDFEKAALLKIHIKLLLLQLRTPLYVCGRVEKLENDWNPKSIKLVLNWLGKSQMRLVAIKR